MLKNPILSSKFNKLSMTEPAGFKMVSQFKPSGDQPFAIDELVKGIKDGKKDQVLLGITGSGKTFTMANVIQQCQVPTIIMQPDSCLSVTGCWWR